MSRKLLRGFVRVDSMGRIVPGSLILRRKAPVKSGGRFIEVTTYTCCAPTTTSSTTTTTTTVLTTTTTSTSTSSTTTTTTTGG